MHHYVGGCGTFPEVGGDNRQDRPYGETEDIWPNDNGLQGFAWMATSIARAAAAGQRRPAQLRAQ